MKRSKRIPQSKRALRLCPSNCHYPGHRGTKAVARETETSTQKTLSQQRLY